MIFRAGLPARGTAVLTCRIRGWRSKTTNRPVTGRSIIDGSPGVCRHSCDRVAVAGARCFGWRNGCDHEGDGSSSAERQCVEAASGGGRGEHRKAIVQPAKRNGSTAERIGDAQHHGAIRLRFHEDARVLGESNQRVRADIRRVRHLRRQTVSVVFDSRAAERARDDEGDHGEEPPDAIRNREASHRSFGADAQWREIAAARLQGSHRNKGG